MKSSLKYLFFIYSTLISFLFSVSVFSQEENPFLPYIPLGKRVKLMQLFDEKENHDNANGFEDELMYVAPIYYHLNSEIGKRQLADYRQNLILKELAET